MRYLVEVPNFGGFAAPGVFAGRPPDVSEVRDLVLFLRGCRAESVQALTAYCDRRNWKCAS